MLTLQPVPIHQKHTLLHGGVPVLRHQIRKVELNLLVERPLPTLQLPDSLPQSLVLLPEGMAILTTGPCSVVQVLQVQLIILSLPVFALSRAPLVSHPWNRI